jgi:hypothetical protein
MSFSPCQKKWEAPYSKTVYCALLNSGRPHLERILFSFGLSPTGTVNNVVLTNFDEGPDMRPNQTLGY